MFTGLVQESGTIRNITRRGSDAELTIACRSLLDELRAGDSVCVDGACLTVREVLKDAFVVDVVAETLARTTLGRLQPGAKVNLELALRPEDRLGGHLVLGHVDGLAVVVDRRAEGHGLRVRYRAPDELAKYLAQKGSVALNGVSLTVAAVEGSEFEVALIPYTLQSTNLGTVQVGGAVNLEVDVLARYVQRAWSAEAHARPMITPEWLRSLGY